MGWYGLGNWSINVILLLDNGVVGVCLSLVGDRLDTIVWGGCARYEYVTWYAALGRGTGVRGVVGSGGMKGSAMSLAAKETGVRG